MFIPMYNKKIRNGPRSSLVLVYKYSCFVKVLEKPERKAFKSMKLK